MIHLALYFTKDGYQKNTANQITNDEIDSVYQSALDAGSTGGKVSGAGGGGFLFFIALIIRNIM